MGWLPLVNRIALTGQDNTHYQMVIPTAAEQALPQHPIVELVSLREFILHPDFYYGYFPPEGETEGKHPLFFWGPG